MKRQGFTLIELLVVIAIIGLLSTMAVVSLNGAREKARDAQRVSDVKQISTALEMFYASKDTYLACTNGGGSDILVSACIEATGFDIANIAIFTDPNGEGLCVADDTSCDYTITDMSASTYEICFALESGSGSLVAGLASVSEGSTMANSCTVHSVH